MTTNNNLWTKNFTIITLGTIVSMLGNSVSGFAISVLVLDYSKSTFLYALFMVVNSLPRIVLPIVAGPYLDRYSRKNMIWGLDFLSSGLYLGIFFILKFYNFNYGIFLFLSLFIGSIDSIYQVAYDSLYPTLVTEGNYRKAYSISSMIYPLAAIMVPVAAFFYKKIGLEPLFIFNSITFFIAATFETQIKVDETHIKAASVLPKGFKGFNQTLKEGISYIVSEKGLLFITIYFCINSFSFGGSSTLTLPFFKSRPELGVMLYTYVMGASVVGRLIGGLVHYAYKFPKHLKFTIAFFVYIAISLIEGSYLFLPIALMITFSFITGVISVTSYNIRISATQSYIPNTHRARFNSSFQMLCTVGSISGQLVSGAAADILPFRTVIIITSIINLIGVFAVVLVGKKHISPIYNREL